MCKGSTTDGTLAVTDKKQLPRPKAEGVTLINRSSESITIPS